MRTKCQQLDLANTCHYAMLNTQPIVLNIPLGLLPLMAPLTAPKAAVESSVGDVLVAFTTMGCRLLGCRFSRF